MQTAKPIIALVASFAAYIAMLAFVAVMAGGCDPTLTPETKTKISATQQDTAIAKAKIEAAATTQKAAVEAAGDVKLAKVKSDAAVNQVQGATAPIAHPLAATNNLVVEFRPWLIWATAIASLGWIALLALRMSGLFVMAGLERFVRFLAILLFVALAALPWLAWASLFIVIAAAALIVFEMVKDKGNVQQAIRDAEAVIGITQTTTTTKANPPSVTTTTETIAPVASTISAATPVDPNATPLH